MAVQPVPTLTAIPPFPQTADRASGTYNSKALAFGNHMAGTFNDEIEALADNVHHNATEAATAATTLSGAADTATAAAIAASADRVLAQTAAGTAASSQSQAATSATTAAAQAAIAVSRAAEATAAAVGAQAIVLGVSTGHPTIRPSLLLDFANSRYVDPRITFTRSSSATRINEKGLIETVATNVPRIDFDPVTLACRGWLIEESRTNVLLNSLIDGTPLTTQSVTVTAVAQTLTFYGTGQVVLSGAHSATLTGTGAFPNCAVLTFTPTAGTLTLTVTGDVKYAQLEAGSFPTSFIPTAGSTATRAADLLTMTGANFTSWYRQGEGTLIADASTFRPYSGALGGQVVSVATDAANRFFIAQGSSEKASFTHFVLGSTVAYMETGGAVVNNGRIQAAIAYKVNDFAFTVNGVTPLTDTSGDVPTMTTLYIGGSITGSAAGNLNGHIRRIAYYPFKLSSSQLQALTS